jgi:enamine deaminase RidA (YjgF/YER057c/UK114 family)
MSVSSIHHLAERRLTELGITLPAMPKPVANYLPFTISGNLLFISGQGPRAADGKYFTGKVGREVTADEAYAHARLVGINLLSVVHHAQNGLSTVRRVVKLTGFVNASDDFQDHPRVVNGCSDLLVEVFGDAGKHARSAVGVTSLPMNITVEIEAIFEVS